VAGVAALVLALVWWGVERLRGVASPLTALVVVHLANVVVYALVGAVLGALWPRRRGRGIRLLLWVLGAAAASLTLVTIVAGPFWRWPLATWGEYAVTSIAFGLVFGPPRWRRAS
jgi:hypothetical protein